MIAIRIKHDHETVREQVFAELPVRIGRGVKNHFVLFDNSVSSEHAVIETNDTGQIVLRDLDSRNGVRVGTDKVAAFIVQRPVRCMLGIVELEIIPLSSDVTREIDVSEWQQVNRRRHFPSYLLYVMTGLAAVLLTLVMDPTFWSPWKDNRLTVVLVSGLLTTVGMALLAFVLLLLLRTAGRKVRLADCLSVISTVLWCLPLLTIGWLAGYYILPNSIYSLTVHALTWIVTIAAAMQLASIRKEVVSTRFRMLVLTIVLLLLSSLESIGYLLRKEVGIPKVNYTVLPPIGGFTGTSKPLATHFKAVERLAQQAGKQKP